MERIALKIWLWIFQCAAYPAIVSVGLAQADPSITVPSLDVRINGVSSGREYELGRAMVGEFPYIDRSYAFRQLPPALDGRIVIRPSMDDDYASSPQHLQFTISAPAKVFVALDQRGTTVPEWLMDWKLSDLSLAVDDVSYNVYQRKFEEGLVTLGGNDRHRTGAPNNYIAIISPAKRVPPFASADYAIKIQPLLASRCYSCHGPEVQEGGLRLDVRRRAFLGGDNESAIVPGSSETSEFIARLVTSDQTQRMPLGETALSPSEIGLLRHWIDAESPWPDEFAGREAFNQHWSFRPIIQPERPIVPHEELPLHPIDAFVRSRLKSVGIEAAPEAERRTLIRRLSLDLLGLPPTPEEVHAFVDDPRADALERLVDNMLESKHFGERWGKHWLDLARFAESDGYENDRPRPHAWHYREWVINAINQDLPFDQFTIQQLAGDLLENSRPEDRIATGFHRNTLHNSAGGADAEEFRSKAVKDQTAITGAVWMGLTLNCCECHTHKYDPISHREYYQMYSFFNDTGHHSEGDSPTLRRNERLTRVHKRGNFLDPGPEVKPDVPSFLPPLEPRGSRPDRLDLARWLTSPDHPLTARVAVNHVWQHLFGQGLVPTPENFGRKGEAPAHLELLDWLASEFSGQRSNSQSESPAITSWSRKSLIRLIVLSSTYRQSSNFPSVPPIADPDNRLLWRQNRYRVEAETVRDLVLAASGLLDRTIGGTSVQPPLPRGISELKELKNENFREVNGNPYRRGLYVHMQRTFTYPMFATFDGPDGNQCTVMRDRSTTPMQALTLLNEPAIDECSKALGRRLIEATQDDVGRIQTGFELCLSRSPATAELEVMLDLVKTQRRDGASEQDLWYGVARALLNLDEMITRE